MKFIQLILFSVFLSQFSIGQNLYTFYLTKAYDKIQEGDFDNAQYYTNKAIARYPDSAECYVQRGGNYYFNEEFELAINDFNKALKLGSTNSDLFKFRGMSYHRIAKYDLAQKDYSIVLSYPIVDSIIFIKTAAIDVKLGDLKSAEKKLHNFNTHNPTYKDGFLILGILYQQMELFEKSLKQFDSAIDLISNDPNLYFYRARVHKELKNEEEMCADLLMAINLGSYEVKSDFDQQNCAEILKIGEKSSNYKYPPPPPELIIEEH